MISPPLSENDEPVIVFKNVSLAFDDTVVLRDVSFTLLPGHFVEIQVPEIGTLVNPVVRAADLIEKEPVA